MLSRFYTHLIWVLLISGLNSCSNDDDGSTPILQGNYQGTFSFLPNNGVANQHPVTVSFNENKYQSSRNPNYIPAGGSGTFEEKIGLVECTDMNIWTTNFNPKLILAGSDKLTIDSNNEILLIKATPTGSYTYRVNRV